MQMCLRDVYCFIVIVICSTVCENRNMQHAHFRLSFILSSFFVQFPWRGTLFVNILPNTAISYLFNIRASKLKRSKILPMFNFAPHHTDLWCTGNVVALILTLANYGGVISRLRNITGTSSGNLSLFVGHTVVSLLYQLRYPCTVLKFDFS